MASRPLMKAHGGAAVFNMQSIFYLSNKYFYDT